MGIILDSVNATIYLDDSGASVQQDEFGNIIVAPSSGTDTHVQLDTLKLPSDPASIASPYDVLSVESVGSGVAVLTVSSAFDALVAGDPNATSNSFLRGDGSWSGMEIRSPVFFTSGDLTLGKLTLTGIAPIADVLKDTGEVIIPDEVRYDSSTNQTEIDLSSFTVTGTWKVVFSYITIDAVVRSPFEFNADSTEWNSGTNNLTVNDNTPINSIINDSGLVISPDSITYTNTQTIINLASQTLPTGTTKWKILYGTMLGTIQTPSVSNVSSDTTLIVSQSSGYIEITNGSRVTLFPASTGKSITITSVMTEDQSDLRSLNAIPTVASILPSDGDKIIFEDEETLHDTSEAVDVVNACSLTNRRGTIKLYAKDDSTWIVQSANDDWIGGGEILWACAGTSATINGIKISSLSNGYSWGTISQSKFDSGACSSQKEQLVIGGSDGSTTYYADVYRLRYSDKGGGELWGSIANARRSFACSSNKYTAFVINGTAGTVSTNTEKINFSNAGTTQSWGTFSNSTNIGWRAASNSIYLVFAGGYITTSINNMYRGLYADDTTFIASWGTLAVAKSYSATTSNSRYVIFAGGTDNGVDIATNSRASISSTGNASSWGTSVSSAERSGSSNADTAVYIDEGSTTTERVEFSSSGNSVSWKTLPSSGARPAVSSNTHGGLQ